MNPPDHAAAAAGQAGRLTEPLGLQRLRKSPRPSFPFVGFLDFCAIGCLFLLLSSRFILTPGLSLDLPQGGEAVTQGILAMNVLTVLSGEGEDRILFDGRVYALEDPRFAEALSKFADKYGSIGSVLLVKLDRETGMQAFFEICELARGAGIGRVHIASEARP